MQLSSILNHYYNNSEIYNKSDKATKPKVAKITETAYNQLKDELAVLGNEFRVNNSRYFVEVSAKEFTNTHTGELFTRYSVWFNSPVTTKVDTPVNVTADSQIETV